MFKKIVIYLVIAILIFGAGYAAASFNTKGQLKQYKDTIAQLTIINGKIIAANREAERYNTELTNKIGEFKELLTKDYTELAGGLGEAENTIDQLSEVIGAAEQTISGVIKAISELIKATENL